MKLTSGDKVFYLHLIGFWMFVFIVINGASVGWAQSEPIMTVGALEVETSTQVQEETPIKVVSEDSDPAAESFFYRCAGCHTVGGGKLTGPDLSESRMWSEADLGVAIKKMEKNTGPLSESDISQMVEFLKDMSVAERIARQKEKVLAKFRASLPAPSFEKGERLFNGEQVLVNGGPACFTCHQFGHEGGSLGPDLSSIKDKASGVVLQSAIEKSSYKIMRSIYEKRKITPEEALHLSEYLSHPEKRRTRFAPSIRLVANVALGGFVTFFALMWVFIKKSKGPTRKKLLQNYLKG